LNFVWDFGFINLQDKKSKFIINYQFYVYLSKSYDYIIFQTLPVNAVIRIVFFNGNVNNFYRSQIPNELIFKDIMIVCFYDLLLWNIDER